MDKIPGTAADLSKLGGGVIVEQVQPRTVDEHVLTTARYNFAIAPTAQGTPQPSLVFTTKVGSGVEVTTPVEYRSVVRVPFSREAFDAFIADCQAFVTRYDEILAEANVETEKPAEEPEAT